MSLTFATTFFVYPASFVSFKPEDLYVHYAVQFFDNQISSMILPRHSISITRTIIKKDIDYNVEMESGIFNNLVREVAEDGTTEIVVRRQSL